MGGRVVMQSLSPLDEERDHSHQGRLRHFARRLLNSSPGLSTIAANIGWLLGDKVCRMAGSLLLTIWLARYLGPIRFGEYSYIVAFIAVFTPIASLGLGDVVVRDIVRAPASAGNTLGMAFILELVGGTIAIALSVSSIHYARPHEPGIQWLVALLSITLLLKATEVAKYWYQARIQSRQTIVIETSLFVAFFFAKVLLILQGYPIEFFIVALVAESACVAVALSARYAIGEGPTWSWSLQWSKIRSLLSDSWPLIFSSGFVLLNMNVDKVMLGGMRDDVEVGYFTAATRLTEAWYFVPVIVGASVAPRLTQLFHTNPAAYRHSAQRVFQALFGVALCVCLAASFLSGPLINILYGPLYKPAAPVLIIHIWTALFVFHASLRTQLLIIENKTVYVFLFSAMALLLNVAANIVLIPWLGAVGASWASLASWMSCVLIFPLLFAHTRSFPSQFLDFTRPRAHV